MTYPILEFDPSPEALIEPSKIIQARDLPEHCVICFFSEVIDKVVSENGATVAVKNRWEDGPHHIYEISYRGQRLAFFIQVWVDRSLPACWRRPSPLAAESSSPVGAVASWKRILPWVT